MAKETETGSTGVDDPRPWGMRGSTWFLFAIPTVFFIVLAMIAVFVLGRGGDDEKASPAETTVTVSPSTPAESSPSEGSAPASSPATSEAGGCPAPKEAKEPATSMPSTTWEVAGQVVAPSTPAGPRIKQKDGVRRCFDRSPHGAVAFAANTFLGFMQSPDIARQVATQQMTPGVHRDQTLKTPGTSDTSVQFSIAGYRVLAWDPNRAQIEFAISVSSQPGTWTLIAPRVVWVNGDWKMDGANAGPTPAPLDSLATITRWAPGEAS